MNLYTCNSNKSYLKEKKKLADKDVALNDFKQEISHV